MASEFGTLLRRLRRQAGMTQEQLSERSTVGVRTIRRLETGDPTDPRLGTVKLLAEALDISPAERRKLLSEAGEEEPEEPAPEPRPRDALTDAADELARVVGGRWQREEEQRRIHDPFPLPVRWQPVSALLTDHDDNIGRAPAGAAAVPLNLTGSLDDIDGTYRRIPSRRLVVLGRAGSGKTVLTLRFVLDYLRTRVAGEPVPVIFSLGSWDPTAGTLRDWLTAQLLRDYPGLTKSAPGHPSLAAALVEAGHILPVLDGFDELAAGLHGPALEALNATTLPLLLTSRPGEYTGAIAATDVLTGAAGIELIDLTPDDLANYLPRTTRRNAEGGTVWDPVLAELRDGRAADLAAVLTTPLMVVLARTVYSDTPGQDPAVLLDTTRFPDRESLEDHLLGSFVPTVYRQQPGAAQPRQGWEADRAQRWLGYLARHLDKLETRDLAWWQLGTALSRSSRILIVVLVASITTAVFDWLFFLPFDVINFGAGLGLRAGLIDGLLVGPVVGLGFGLVYGLMVVVGGTVFEPSRMRVRLFGRGDRGGGLARRFVVRMGAGILGGFVVGLGYGPVTMLARLLMFGFPEELGWVVEAAGINMITTGLIFGLAAGPVFGLATVLEAPLDLNAVTSPAGLVAANRTTVLRQVLLLVPLLIVAIMVMGWVVVGLLQGVLGELVWTLSGGLLTGAVGGLGAGFAYAFAFTAWGQWVILARVWLPLTGKLPWAMLAFLEDAYQRGVLRQAGAVYQFRHARLQDHLSRTHPA
ncbi:NACHT domain-containing protein [Amycolatopsis xylanica]|uniref:NACHT domain-containing protein n=1 Tax=Amycolatopsis xylanica TaxID=589385 RepID=A0A1H3PE13_9PSEU|nr:helix-turn-helix transcriptional regulator [Amycolatopsis xylanica]SDY99183.1 NACHT domain-containing protein [Amycolatopsis xylanica]